MQPTELLGSLLRHCQQVSQELWPTSETGDDDSWKSGLDTHADVYVLKSWRLGGYLVIILFSQRCASGPVNPR